MRNQWIYFVCSSCWSKSNMKIPEQKFKKKTEKICKQNYCIRSKVTIFIYSMFTLAAVQIANQLWCVWSMWSTCISTHTKNEEKSKPKIFNFQFVRDLFGQIGNFSLFSHSNFAEKFPKMSNENVSINYLSKKNLAKNGWTKIKTENYFVDRLSATVNVLSTFSIRLFFSLVRC